EYCFPDVVLGYRERERHGFNTKLVQIIIIEILLKGLLIDAWCPIRLVVDDIWTGDVITAENLTPAYCTEECVICNNDNLTRLPLREVRCRRDPKQLASNMCNARKASLVLFPPCKWSGLLVGRFVQIPNSDAHSCRRSARYSPALGEGSPFLVIPSHDSGANRSSTWYRITGSDISQKTTDLSLQNFKEDEENMTFVRKPMKSNRLSQLTVVEMMPLFGFTVSNGLAPPEVFLRDTNHELLQVWSLEEQSWEGTSCLRWSKMAGVKKGFICGIATDEIIKDMVWITLCSRSRENVFDSEAAAKQTCFKKEIKTEDPKAFENDQLIFGLKQVTWSNLISIQSPTFQINDTVYKVHTFLKETDNVLSCYEQTTAEDKCLLLIKKPKSSSKQMLKAASCSNLAGPDTQTRPSEPSGIPNPLFKRRTYDFRSSRDAINENPGNYSLSTNQELDSVIEHEDGTNVVKHKSTHNGQQNLYTSCPVEDKISQERLKPASRQKSFSTQDLRRESEINNNHKMGGSASHQGKSKKEGQKFQGQGHASQDDSFGFQGQGHKPRGHPPPVPDRRNKGDDHGSRDNLNDSSHNHSHQRLNSGPPSGKSDPRHDTSVTHGNVHAYTRSQSSPSGNTHLTNNVSAENFPSQRDKQTSHRGNLQHNNREHPHGTPNSASYLQGAVPSHGRVDTNAHGRKGDEHTNGNNRKSSKSNDVYNDGFKHDLSVSARNGHHVTSSPKSSRKGDKSDRRYGEKVIGSNSNMSNVPNVSQMNSIPQQASKNGMRPQQGNNVPMPQQGSNVHMPQQGNNVPMPQQGNNVPMPQQGSNVHMPQQGNNVPMPQQGKNVPMPQQGNNVPMPQQGSNVPMPQQGNNSVLNDRGNTWAGSRDLREKQTNRPVQRNKSDTSGYNGERQKVMKAKSLIDLSEGKTFSLVGQRKPENSMSTEGQGQSSVGEFTGSQMMKHIRKYREIQKSGHGNLLPKGTAIDDMEVSIQRDHDLSKSQPNNNRPNSGYGTTNGKPMHYGSLQHLPMSTMEPQPQVTSLKHREQTPLKPRRCLPQTPGNVSEKKRRVSDTLKSRMSVSSQSSNTSPSSSNSASNRGESADLRQGGVSATPSDREVDLYIGSKSDNLWAYPNHMPTHGPSGDATAYGKQQTCYLPQDGYKGHPSMNVIRKSGSFGAHDQSIVVAGGGRWSESGQTTLTSQSTTDSGYLTTDPDHDTLSSTNYARTLQQSAHNIFKRHSQKNDNAKGSNHQPVDKVDNFVINKGGNQSQKVKDSHAHTQSWLENHPGAFVGDSFKLSVNEQDSEMLNLSQNVTSKPNCVKGRDSRDSNNNKNEKHAQDEVTELDIVQSGIKKKQSSNEHPRLSHHLSEMSVQDMGKVLEHEALVKPKGRSVSMSQGLNLIGAGSNLNTGNLTKSQPKFTGSLKDLIGGDKTIVPIETLKLEKSSLKLLGKPSLFQLLQNYNLYAVRVEIPPGFVVSENIRMIECEVALASPWLHARENPVLQSPKGSYAKLGGPNSAFKPVTSGSGSPIKTVSMVTIMELSNEMSSLLNDRQELQRGDLILEIDERLVIGEDLATLTNVLRASHTELLLTIVRDKARDRSAPTEDDFRQMEQRLTQLTMELQKKDRTIRQLNEMLPWKRESKGDHSETKGDDGYLCSLSEDEFIIY
ncbi:VLPF-like protein, partial [Mya arenaria]